MSARDHDADFATFHAANPHVLKALTRLADEARLQGRKRIGMKALVERARWDLGLRTDGKPYRLNNNLTSRYARLIASTRPELAPLFQFRGLAEGPPAPRCPALAPFTGRQCERDHGHAEKWHAAGLQTPLEVETWRDREAA